MRNKPKGYWKSWDNLVREIEPLIKKLGHFPTYTELQKLGRSDIINATFTYHGKLHSIAEKMGYEPIKKPLGFWKDWNNLVDELMPIIDKLGYFPTIKEFRDLERFDIVNAIYYHHGGAWKVAKKLGYSISKKPNKYWVDWNIIVVELTPIIKELGHFPTTTELYEINRGDIVTALYIHGGIHNVAKKMGFEMDRKPPGYWTWNNLVKEIKPIIDRLSYFPTREELFSMGKASIEGAMVQYHDGRRNVAKKLGYKLSEKPKKYWDNWDNLVNELKPIIEKIGHFPSHNELRDLKRHDILHGLNKHGGSLKVAENMGYEISIIPRGYWMEWDNVKTELEEVIKTLEHFPTTSELYQMEKSGLIQGLYYHGGIFTVAQKMGFIKDRMPMGYWKDWDNLVKELNIVIKELGHFPIQRELHELGKTTIGAAIVQYHGGFYTVASRLGFDPKVKPKGYWADVNNIINELSIIIEELGHFPISGELKDLGHSYLLPAIVRHGGMFKIAEQMGYKISTHPIGYWDDFENVKKELKPLIDKLGRFPTSMEVRQVSPAVENAITNKYGGYFEVAKMMGYSISDRCYEARDGHLLRSSYEETVDNWLFTNGIDHEIEPRISDKSQHRGDFKVDDFIIEVWGMHGSKWVSPYDGLTYDEKTKLIKIPIYNKSNYKLIEIYPEDIPNNLYSKLGFLIDKYSKWQKTING